MQAWFTKGKNLHKLKHENEQQTKVIKESKRESTINSLISKPTITHYVFRPTCVFKTD